MTNNDDIWTECLKCGKRVKEKNLDKHLRRVHELSNTDIKNLKANIVRNRKRNLKWSSRIESLNKKFVLIVITIVVIVILAVLVSEYVIPKNNNSTPTVNNNGNSQPADPYRVEFTTSDGFKIVGSYYNAKGSVISSSTDERPVLILVHGMNEKRAVWNNYGLVDDALKWGFNVLTYDIRGHGESIYKNGNRHDVNSFGNEDFTNMDEDIKAAEEFVINNKATNGFFVVIGASIGANAALNAAVDSNNIKALVLLSPGLNYHDITTYNPIYNYGSTRAIFLAADLLEPAADDCQTLYDHAMELDNTRNNVLLKTYTKESREPNEYFHGTNLLKIDNFKVNLEDWLKTNCF